MIRQLTSVSFHLIDTDYFVWYVVLERLHNTYSGCPRFKATLIISYDKQCNISYEAGCCNVYTFSGHYQDDIYEAKHIVNYHENKMKEKGVL